MKTCVLNCTISLSHPAFFLKKKMFSLFFCSTILTIKFLGQLLYNHFVYDVNINLDDCLCCQCTNRKSQSKASHWLYTTIFSIGHVFSGEINTDRRHYWNNVFFSSLKWLNFFPPIHIYIYCNKAWIILKYVRFSLPLSVRRAVLFNCLFI